MQRASEQCLSARSLNSAPLGNATLKKFKRVSWRVAFGINVLVSPEVCHLKSMCVGQRLVRLVVKSAKMRPPLVKPTREERITTATHLQVSTPKIFDASTTHLAESMHLAEY